MTFHQIIRLAPAKINLTLDVLTRREDGYHDIRSIMQTITLADRLTVTHTPGTPGVALDVVGPEAHGIPMDASNLVHRAAVRLQKTAVARGIFNAYSSGLHIRLEKNIPSQAGLGGGSSDAAAALLAINDLLGLDLSRERLASVAEALGADVSFFLWGGTALVEGLGERVTPLPLMIPAWPLVIVKPNVGVSTPWAYGALDAIPNRIPGNATTYWQETQELNNDFHAPVAQAFPEILSVINVLKDNAFPSKTWGPMLSGSGAAVFRRMPDIASAEEMAQRAREANVGRAWVTETCR